jgi:D-mannonate dehydratase
MTKDEARELFIDYMYGGLDIDKQQQLEAFVKQHPDLKDELDGMMETRQVLQQMPVESPTEQFVMMDPAVAKRSFRSSFEKLWAALSPTSGFGRFGVAVASFVFLFIITGSLTNLNFSMQDGEVSLRFGEQSPAQVGYSAAQVEMIINQVQAENAELVAEIVQAAQEQQESQFQQTLASFASYLDEQRASDLELIDYSLSNLQETTYNRFVQTDQVLGEIIETVSYNQ